MGAMTLSATEPDGERRLRIALPMEQTERARWRQTNLSPSWCGDVGLRSFYHAGVTIVHERMAKHEKVVLLRCVTLHPVSDAKIRIGRQCCH
jgi:hypothetical protein